MHVGGAAPQLADDEWLAAWRMFLLALNHRRDVLRASLGGLVIAAPPAVKVVAQRESPDLWSIRDLLIELAPRVITSDRAMEPSRVDEPRRASGATGLPYESDDAELAEEAQVLLAMPVTELAGPVRECISGAVHRALARGDEQLAAVLLLAQSDGYSTAGDSAGALHLVQQSLTLGSIEARNPGTSAQLRRGAGHRHLRTRTGTAVRSRVGGSDRTASVSRGPRSPTRPLRQPRGELRPG